MLYGLKLHKIYEGNRQGNNINKLLKFSLIYQNSKTALKFSFDGKKLT